MLPQRRRAWVVWGLVAGGLMAVVMTAGVVCWFKLPVWAPYWVIDHSPFIDPVVRALVVVNPPPTGTPESTGGPPFVLDRIVTAEDEARGQRLKQLAAGAIPFLGHCLDSGDRGIRLQALEMLSWNRLPANDRLLDLLKHPDPWLRLKAQDQLEWRAERRDGSDFEIDVVPIHQEPIDAVAQDGLVLLDDPAYQRSVDAAAQGALALLDDRDGFIRKSVRIYLVSQESLPWSVRIELYSRLRQVSEREFFIPLLKELFDREVEEDPSYKLPGTLLFTLLSLAQVADGDPGLRNLVAEQLPRVEQDFAALLVQLTAMQRGVQPWPPGAETWMAERLRLLTEQRITLSLKDADLTDVVARYFSMHNVLVDPRVIASAPPPATLEITDGRLIDALLALAKATGTKLQLNCDAVLLVHPSDSNIGGFAPSLPAIHIASGVDPTAASTRSRLIDLQRRYTTPAGDPPIVQILADLNHQSGIAIAVEGGVIETDAILFGSRLHQISLDHLLRLMAWYAGVQVELGATGIRFYDLQKK